MEKIKPVEYHPSHDETIFAMFNKINEIIDWINGFEEGNEYSKKVLKTLEEEVEYLKNANNDNQDVIQQQGQMIKFIMENSTAKDGIFAIFETMDSGKAFKIGEPLYIKTLQDIRDERFIKEYHDKVGDAIMNEYIGEPTVKERYCKGIKEIKFNQPVVKKRRLKR